MSSPVIEATGLSKKFVISHQNVKKAVSFRDSVTESVTSVFKRKKMHEEKVSESKETFWALKDVNFQINQGERLAIIGRNGSGKSTLLKILSRISEPSSGTVKIKGRVASLLEVGTGFHSELSGRENIFLNGAILGLSKQEIRSKFDEIVDFSEVEQFLDTPVKRYSSGMIVRLAFAVAAHLEPEILIVDEVLAVGDAQFQKRCLGKLADVSNQDGRTVLFVSHQISAIKALCETGILLSHGRLLEQGPILNIVDHYNRLQEDIDEREFIEYKSSLADYIKVTNIRVNEQTRNPIPVLPDKTKFEISIDFELAQTEKLNMELQVYDSFNQALAFFSPGHFEGFSETFGPGKHNITKDISFPGGINKGQYFADLKLTSTGFHTHFEALKLFVFDAEGSPSKTGSIFDYESGRGWLFLDAAADVRV